MFSNRSFSVPKEDTAQRSSFFNFKAFPYNTQDAQSSKTSLIQDVQTEHFATGRVSRQESMTAPSTVRIQQSRTLSFDTLSRIKRRFSLKRSKTMSAATNVDSRLRKPELEKRSQSMPDIEVLKSKEPELPLIDQTELTKIIIEVLPSGLPLPDATVNETDLKRATFDQKIDRFETDIRQISTTYDSILKRLNTAIKSKELELQKQLDNSVLPRPQSTTSSFYPEDEISNTRVSHLTAMSRESAVPASLAPSPKPNQEKPLSVRAQDAILNARAFLFKASPYAREDMDDQYDAAIKSSFFMNNYQELLGHINDLKAVKSELIETILGVDTATENKDPKTMTSISNAPGKPPAKIFELLKETGIQLHELETIRKENPYF